MPDIKAGGSGPAGVAGAAGPSAFYGVGSDGVVNFDGTTAVVLHGLTMTPVASVYTLLCNVYASELYIGVGVVINAAGFCLWASDSINMELGSIIQNNGPNGTDGVGGGAAGAGTPSAFLGASGAGGNGNVGAGSNAFAKTYSASVLDDGVSKTAGAGGLGGSGGGGTGSLTSSIPEIAGGCAVLTNATFLRYGITSPSLIGGGGGGGGGGGNGAVKGGGGGAGGGPVFVGSPSISAPNGATIQALGGDGGDGDPAGNTGGGGGGMGGAVIVYTGVTQVVANVTTLVTKGNKGLKGGAGADGGDGVDGFVRWVVIA